MVSQLILVSVSETRAEVRSMAVSSGCVFVVGTSNKITCPISRAPHKEMLAAIKAS
ncbi:hypothetical protein D9M68_785030 [compost metagenome]